MKLPLLVIFSIFEYSEGYWYPQEDFRQRSICTEQEPQNCTMAGPLCETCRTLVICVQVGPGEYEKTSITPCDADQKCSQRQCTSDPDPICDGTACKQFPCTKVGVFPDPFFCDKYIMCVQTTPSRLDGYVVQCEEGWGYDIAKKNCDIQLPNGICNTTDNNYPVPLCLQAGQNGAIPEDPSMFYICEAYDEFDKILYPKLYLCANGWVYENYECKDPTATIPPPF